MFSSEISSRASKVVSVYRAENRKLVTAESCTGGLIAAALTDIPGSSAVLERGFVTYSLDAKVEVLGVMPDVLAEYGAVSARVAEDMAQGALEFSRADVAISATGIAGPEGGSAENPTGTVYFGLATRDNFLIHYKCVFPGDREAVRMHAVGEALKLLLSITKHG
ncbi:MAG: CinA family protein [Alphaproteobacteria bacterium]|nr:CinA family protein [Alphaproteobacteria bacterium]